MKKVIMAGLMGFTLTACLTTPEAENLADLSVSFDWKNTKACSSASPAFEVGNVPAGSEYLRFKMTDLNVPTFRHGGGDVAYQGQAQVPAGAFIYKGPCPPSGQHNYRFEVVALNADKSLILGKGTATKAFPPQN